MPSRDLLRELLRSPPSSLPWWLPWWLPPLERLLRRRRDSSPSPPPFGRRPSPPSAGAWPLPAAPGGWSGDWAGSTFVRCMGVPSGFVLRLGVPSGFVLRLAVPSGFVKRRRDDAGRLLSPSLWASMPAVLAARRPECADSRPHGAQDTQEVGSSTLGSIDLT